MGWGGGAGASRERGGTARWREARPGDKAFALACCAVLAGYNNVLGVHPWHNRRYVRVNLGATGAVTLTLPTSAPAGTVFSFAVQAAYELRVDPGTGTIRDDSGQTAGKYKSADAIGECLSLLADSNGDWATIAKNGNWTEEV